MQLQVSIAQRGFHQIEWDSRINTISIQLSMAPYKLLYEGRKTSDKIRSGIVLKPCEIVQWDMNVNCQFMMVINSL